jgi:hypothetical protein
MRAKLPPRLRLALVLALAVGAVPALAQTKGADKPVELRLSFADEAMTQYVYRSSGELTFDVPAALAEMSPIDPKQPVHYTSEIRFTTTLRSIEDGCAKLNLSFDSISFDAEGFGHKVSIIATNDEARVEVDGEVTFTTKEGKLAQLPIAALVFGRELFVLRVTPCGDVVGVDLTGLLAAVSDTPAVQKVFAQLAEVLPALFPVEAVVPGSQWAAPVDLNVPELDLHGGGTMRSELLSIDGAEGARIAHVGFRGSIGLAEFNLATAFRNLPMVGEDADDMDLPDIVLSGLTKIRGDLDFDIDAGVLRRLSIRGDLDTRIEVGEGELSLGIAITGEGTLERLEPGR